MTKIRKFNIKEYKKVASKECFICNIVRGGDKRKQHFILYEDENFIAFLNNYPTKEGQSLVCPKKHLSHIFELKDKEYTEFMLCAKKIGKTIQAETNAVRMYFLSLGSNELNDHIHLHIFPLPADVPYDEQQFAAMNAEKKGFIDFSSEEKEQIGNRINFFLEIH